MHRTVPAVWFLSVVRRLAPARPVIGPTLACGMSFHDVQRRLDTLLRDAGCERYTARQALADAAECWREIRQDSIAHGGSGEVPFFNFVVAEGVGVFAFYGTGVEFYVIPGDEWQFRDRFEPLAMTEVEPARAIISSEFKRSAPDVTVEAPLSGAWLQASDGGAAAG
jgi:hypothetical protein